MKTSMLITAVIMLFVCCNKEKNEAVTPDPGTQKYGISVKDGRLNFATIADLKAVTELQEEERTKMLTYVKGLPGFKSRAKSQQAMNKMGCECTCDLKDDYATALVDENFMMNVGYWTVRLNGCNEKYYAFYKQGLSELEVTKGLDAMRAGDFHTYQFYEIPQEYDLMEELSIYEEIFAGNPNASERRCKDVPASDRLAVLPRQVISGYLIPEFQLFYRRGWLNHGFIHVTSPQLHEDDNFQGHWFIELHPSEFREKCGDIVTRGPAAGIIFLGPNIIDEHDGTWFERRFYEGPRVKAGEGNFIVRIFHPGRPNTIGHDFIYTSPFMEILF